MVKVRLVRLFVRAFKRMTHDKVEKRDLKLCHQFRVRAPEPEATARQGEVGISLKGSCCHEFHSKHWGMSFGICW